MVTKLVTEGYGRHCFSGSELQA